MAAICQKIFEIWTNGIHFVKNHLKSGQKHLNFEWSGFQMVETIATSIAIVQPFKNQKTDYSKSDLEKVLIINVLEF